MNLSLTRDLCLLKNVSLERVAWRAEAAIYSFPYLLFYSVVLQLQTAIAQSPLLKKKNFLTLDRVEPTVCGSAANHA